MEQNSKINPRSETEPASDYKLKYPEKYHDLLARLGEDDRNIPALIGFNHELIKLAEDCQGKRWPGLRRVRGTADARLGANSGPLSHQTGASSRAGRAPP